VSVREGQSYGEFHTPKTGQREIPITPPLARLLAPVEQGPKGKLVALNREGKPWGQYGLARAFERVRNRAGLDGWSVYSLRHYAITSWLRAGVPVHVVQRMAGHSNLATTQRYIHHLKEDLEDAARRLVRSAEARSNGGAAAPTPPEDDAQGWGNSGATGSRPSPGARPRKR
jgi:integrase